MARDLKQQYITLYEAKTAPSFVKAPSRQFLMVDGNGDPNETDYAEAVSALYRVAYSLRAALKQEGREFTVPPLEALWWAADMSAFITPGQRSAWRWTAMLAVPDDVTAVEVATAQATVIARHKTAETVRAIRLATFEEGECVQVLHVGPYCEERRTIAALHGFIEAAAMRPAGMHHEVYVADPRRTAPEKLRTIIRQPVAAA